MQLAIPLRRENISEQLVNALRNLIVDGSLGAGERINEVHLAGRLGVSRTPLREALALLAREGALSSIPRIGWFVKPLSLEEFDQLYPIRAMLDPEALRLAGLPSPARIEQLDRLNRRIISAEDSDDVIGLDDEWHLLLIADCPNKVLLELIGDFIGRTRRYELALMRAKPNVAVAVDSHRQILDAIRTGNLEAAVAALKVNLQTGQEPIRRWLMSREEAQ